MSCGDVTEMSPSHQTGATQALAQAESQRDPTFEASMLRQAVEACHSLRHSDTLPTGFEREVKERLAMGDKFENAYLERENVLEALPEAADLAAYPILEIEKRRGSMPEDRINQLRMRALTIAMHAAAAHHEALKMQAELGDG